MDGLSGSLTLSYYFQVSGVERIPAMFCCWYCTCLFW